MRVAEGIDERESGGGSNTVFAQCRLQVITERRRWRRQWPPYFAIMLVAEGQHAMSGAGTSAVASGVVTGGEKDGRGSGV